MRYKRGCQLEDTVTYGDVICSPMCAMNNGFNYHVFIFN